MNKHESDIQELNEKKADKSELDTKADKATVYTKSETDTILSTKADKATTYTIAQTDTILSTKADKAYTYTKAEVDSIADDVKEKVDDYLIPETSSLSAQLIYVGEHKADRSELPTKVSQLENDKNYVIQEEIQPIYQDINYLDTQTRNLEAKKADKFDTYTAAETDDMLSTKADKADLDWKLIGEEVVTDADITAAGEAGVTAVTIDLGAPIEQWYKETRIDIIIPASTDINSVNNGLFVCMGATEALSLNSDSGCVLMRSQGNTYAVLQYQYLNQIIFHTVWDKALPLYSLFVNSPYNGYAYAYNVYGATTFKQKTKTAIGCQFISVSTKSNVGIFKFPAGTKISIYGRM